MLNKKSQLILLLLPVLLAVSGLVLEHGRGPFWLGNNLDPEYVYLLNGLNLAEMKGVGHIDHPGTPVQILTALTIRAVYSLTTPGGISLAKDVLSRPEFYLKIINRIEIILNALLLLMVGLVAYRLSGRLWWSLWLQAAPFFSPVLLQFGLTRVTPEPMLFLTSSGVILLALVTAFPLDKETVQKRQAAMVIGWGLVIGMGIACKITFIPLLVIPLVVLPRLKYKFYYLLALVLSLVLFTLPIIRMYPQFFKWMVNLASHAGHYGSGSSITLPTGLYLKNLQSLLIGHPFFTMVLILSVVVILLSALWPHRQGGVSGSMPFKLLTAMASAQILGLLMVAKHSSLHYLLPVLNLSGMMLFMLFCHIKNQIATSHNPAHKPLITVVFIVFIVGSAVLLNPWAKGVEMMRKATHSREVLMALHQQVEKKYENFAKIYYYRSSAPEYALKFGDDLARSYHAEILDQLYPNAYFYDIWTHRFSRFGYNQCISFASIQEKHGDQIVFQGTRGQKIEGLTLQTVSTLNSQEGIFILAPEQQQ